MRKFPSWMTKNVQSGVGVLMKEEKKNNFSFEGRIQYCPTIDDIGLACEELLSLADQRDELILGFDAEWPVTYQEGSGKIALIQICLDETCYLFHVSFIKSLPKIFLNLIQHPKVIIVGNCVENDIWKLGRDFNILVSKLVGSGRVIDLGKLAKNVLNCAQSWSLQRLALHLLSINIDKTDSIRKSRWDLQLSAEQQLYAATDTYVSLAIFKKLKDKQLSTTQS